MQTNTDDVLLTTKDVAKRLNINPGTLINWRAERKGPNFVKMGRSKGCSVRYRLSDVVAFEQRMSVRTKEGG